MLCLVLALIDMFTMILPSGISEPFFHHFVAAEYESRSLSVGRFSSTLSADESAGKFSHLAPADPFSSALPTDPFQVPPKTRCLHRKLISGRTIEANLHLLTSSPSNFTSYVAQVKHEHGLSTPKREIFDNRSGNNFERNYLFTLIHVM